MHLCSVKNERQDGHNGVVKVLPPLLLQALSAVQTESCLDGAPIFSTNLFMFLLCLPMVGPGAALLAGGNEALLGGGNFWIEAF